jgi:integrase
MEKAQVSFAGWLGPRISEAFGLGWSDLDFKRKLVTFQRGFVSGRISAFKTGASRTSVPLPFEVIEALPAWRELTPYNADADWVFASLHSHGRLPYYPGQFLKHRIKPVAKELGLGNIVWRTRSGTVSAAGARRR